VVQNSAHSHPLHRVIARLRRRVYLARAVWLLGLLAVIALVAVAGWVRLAGDLPIARLIALSVPLIVLGTLTLLVWRVPSPTQLARIAESHLGLAERLSTAWAALQRGSHSLLDQALLEETAGIEAQVDARRVVQMPLRPVAVLTSVGLAVALLVYLLPLQTTPDAAAPASVALDWQETEALARRVGTLIAAQAEADSTYLQAVGRAFTEIADQIARGERDESRTRQALESLLSHLTQAAGEEGGAWAQLPEVLERALATAVNPDAGLTQPDDLLSGLLESNQTVRPLDTEIAERLGGPQFAIDPSEALAAALAELERQQQQKEQIETLSFRALGDNPPAPTEVGYLNVDPEQLAALEERRRLFDAAATRADGASPVGAAQESTEGGGDLAGAGSRAFDEGAELNATFEADVERVEVASIARADGETYQIDTAVNSSLTTIADDVWLSGAEPWWPVAQAAQANSSIGLAQRAVVSRYFLPATTESALP